MSYANGTTHYNLPQTVGTDKRDWFDTNEAFASVDAALNTAYDTAASTASNVSALTDRVTANEGDITDLKAEDIAINARVSTLGDSVSALSATVRDNKQDLSDAICSVVEGSATAEYNHAVDTYFWYNDTLYITTVAISIGDTIVPNTNCDTVTVTTELNKIAESETTPTLYETDGTATDTKAIKAGNCVTLLVEITNGTASANATLATLDSDLKPSAEVRALGVLESVTGGGATVQATTFKIDTDGHVIALSNIANAYGQIIFIYSV